MNNFFIVLLLLFQSILAVIYRLTDEEYRLMPPLVSLDPYERCFEQHDAVYCSAQYAYVSDEPSPLLTQMKEYSEHTAKRFNHTKSFYGVCITTTCKHLFNSTADPRWLLEACLNETLYQNYKLKVRVIDKVACETRGENNINVATIDVIIAAICFSIVLLNIMGTFYYANFTKKSGTIAQFLLCFSIQRNWRKLKAPPAENQDPRLKRLRGIHGIRAISMALVIIGHAMLPVLVLGDDAHFFEKQYDNPLIHLMLNGSLIMQTFLVISAFLLVYNIQLASEKHNITWKILLVSFVKRWLRLTPANALVLGLTATWLRYVSTGPLWEEMVVLEADECRKDWWSHLLYINNYIDGSYCMPQAWYSAADTQLYILGLVVCLFSRNLKIRKVVLSTLFLVGFITPALHTYFQDLNGTLIVSPTAIMDFFTKDPTFNKVHKRGHTNLTGYVIGLTLGYVLYDIQKNKFDASKFKQWRPLYWCVFPLGFSMILANKIFYEEGPQAAMGYRILVAVVTKPLFALFVSALILGMILKIENVYRSILEWGGWTSVGRVSYSAYLLHVAIIRTWVGMYTHTIDSSYMRIYELVTTIFVTTYVSAYIFWLTVEAPFGQVTRMFFDGPPKPNNREKKHD